jgi:Tfp pilus assembly protein PilF
MVIHMLQLRVTNHRSMPLRPVLQTLMAAFLLTLTWPAAARDLPGAPDPTHQERLTLARTDILAGNWAAAKAGLLEAAREAPADADVHNLLGFVYRKQAVRDLPRAFAHYRMALRFDPRHRGAHEYIGEAYLLDHQPAQARHHLQSLEQICGNRECEEYRDLAAAIARHEAAAK